MAETRTRGGGRPASPAIGEPELADAAERVSALFAGLVSQLGTWRQEILAGGMLSRAALNERVGAIVIPELESDDPLLIGAGFIASPDYANTPDVHFAWWLGPLDDNPVFGATTRATPLDLGARNYAAYLRDLRSLEWYRIPESTHQTHITGPYVDHLCACDYIVTVTSPVERAGEMIGVVGVDVSIRRLERELLPVLLGLAEPAALINASGRVVVSTDAAVGSGSVLAADTGEPADVRAGVADCAGTPFRLVLTSHSR